MSCEPVRARIQGTSLAPCGLGLQGSNDLPCHADGPGAFTYDQRVQGRFVSDAGPGDCMHTQLDLFQDSRAVVLANEAIDALAARDAARAETNVGKLRCEAPETRSLPPLETLTAALAGWRVPGADSAAIVQAVEWLENEIAPAANQALGRAAHAFMSGFFHDLAEVAQGLAYDASRPAAHRASLCLRCGEWAEAEAAAHSIPRSNAIPDALHWLCVARHRQHGLAAARSALFALAWHAPARLAPTLEELGDELLDRDWQAFGRACEWESVGEAELPAWFPAWYLLEHPAVAAEFDGVEFPDCAPARAARLLLALFELERQGNWRKLARTREQLRLLNSDLFSLYMARRAVQLR